MLSSSCHNCTLGAVPGELLGVAVHPVPPPVAYKGTLPISDSRARFVHFCRVEKLFSLCRREVSLSGGTCTTVSI